MIRILLLAILVLAIPACSKDATEPNITPGAPEPWLRVLGSPHSGRDVVAFSPTQVFALGRNGHISHFDGQDWRMVEVLGGWGMLSLWGTTPNHLVMVGFKGRIGRFDGSTWSEWNSGSESTLRGIWGTAPFDIHVVGDAGTILHHAPAGAWTPEDSGTENTLHAVHGSADGHVFAVGDAGTFLHKSPAGTWTPIAHSFSADLYGVWAASSDWVIAVGEAELGGLLVAQQVGNTWEITSSQPAITLRSVSGRTPEEVWAVGEGGAWNWDGSGWTEDRSGSDILGVDFAPDGTLALQYERNRCDIRSNDVWTSWDNGLGSLSISSIWGASDTDIVLTQYWGAALNYDGAGFQPLNGSPVFLRQAWGTPDGEKVYFVGDESLIHLRENGVLREFHRVVSTRALAHIWGIGDELWVGGEEGWVSHYDGAGWTDTQLPTPFRNRYIHGIHGSTRDQVYAITTDSVFRFDGSGWSLFEEFGEGYFLDNILASASDEIYVEGSFEFGSNGLYLELHYYDGSEWQLPVRNSTYSIAGLVQAPDGTIVGAGITHYGDPLGFVMTGRYLDWEFESVDVFPGFGINHLWISSDSYLYLDDGTLWRSREPFLPD